MYIIYGDDNPQMWVDISFKDHVAHVRTAGRYNKFFCDALYYDKKENEFLKAAAEMAVTRYTDTYKFAVFLSFKNACTFVLMRTPGRASRYFTFQLNDKEITYGFHPKLNILFEARQTMDFYFAIDEPQNDNPDRAWRMTRPKL